MIKYSLVQLLKTKNKKQKQKTKTIPPPFHTSTPPHLHTMAKRRSHSRSRYSQKGGFWGALLQQVAVPLGLTAAKEAVTRRRERGNMERLNYQNIQGSPIKLSRKRRTNRHRKRH